MIFILPDPLEFCAYCGELLAAHGITSPADAFRGQDNSVYCCEDCRHEGEAELWEMRAYPPAFALKQEPAEHFVPRSTGTDQMRLFPPNMKRASLPGQLELVNPDETIE